MMIRWIPICLIAVGLYNMTAPPKYSRNIDFGKMDVRQLAYLIPYHDQIPHVGFNASPEIGDFVQSLRDDFGLEAAVETGTFKGATTHFLSCCFDEVHTVDLSKEFQEEAKKRIGEKSNTSFHLGSSESVLKEILPALKGKRTLFYLDAHWHDYCPLLDELEAIGKTHKDNCIIVIDDFKVPKRKEFQYDKYGEVRCSYTCIKDQLNCVFTSYEYYYLLPKDAVSKAKFLAIPKKWLKKETPLYKPKFEIASDFISSAMNFANGSMAPSTLADSSAAK
jgi:predicted O-methyltransferase YrrM